MAPIPCRKTDPLVNEEIEEVSTTLNLTCNNIDLREELAVNDFSKLFISLGHVVSKDARTTF